MTRYVLDLREIDQTQIAVAGGKGGNLGELSRIEDARVPEGFCVTTDAFRQIVAASPEIEDHLDRLSRVTAGDHEAIRVISARVRRVFDKIAMPEELVAAVERSVARLGPDGAYAVRSSATSEDSPTASFAGLHDSYLNVVGLAAILQHVSRCWASLFSERAVTYRLRKGIDHRKVSMAVVVQQMVSARAAGVLFTADPVTGNRRVAAVEASLGLGDALVSGRANADVFKVRDNEIIARTIAADRQHEPALTDGQAVRLVQLGRLIEAHFGRPQDIEWCLVDDEYQIVQSRPITTLFPIPNAANGENRVYVSTGHGQMMTDAMKPLGISVWQLTGATTFHEAGGRLFVDVTRALASPGSREALLQLIGKSDPLIGDALRTIHARGFVAPLPDAASAGPPGGAVPAPIETDPRIVDDLIGRIHTSIGALKRDIHAKSGPALLDFILADFQELKRVLFDPLSHQAIMAGMEAAWWLNDRLEAWLGEKNAAAALTQSVPNNVTSEMGLALLDVADVIRPHPAVVAFLRRVTDDRFLDELPTLAGGPAARDAIVGWLDKYGMRCVGEIDITRARWSERPTMLLPMLIGNIRNSEPGAGKRRFAQGRENALKKEHEVLARLRGLPDGASKAEETKRMIDRVRTFAGYREYPKYGMVSRYFLYKQALLGEAERLVQSHVLRETEDIFYLTLQELADVVRTNRVDDRLIHERKAAFESYQALVPPRVLTSEGEAVSGSYARGDVPDGALVGLSVSSGIVEGRARVVLEMENATLEPGDILVTAYTDPSWTPLFVAINGLVTEVGGLMTHGAVIAREYGLPAIVGVEHATRLIRDGQRIRLNATDGYVEVLR